MKKTACTLLLFASAPAAFAQAPAPAGGEFRVNAFTVGRQTAPAAAAFPGGRTIVAWSSDTADGSGQGVVARLLDADGTPLGPEFVVNEYTSGDQTEVSVAAGDDGRAMVAWVSNGQDGIGYVFARMVNGRGTLMGAEFPVNTDIVGIHHAVQVAAIPGGYVVAWESQLHVSARVFNAAGRPVGDELLVSTSGYAHAPAAAGMSDGGFIVAWSVETGSVMARRYTMAGPSGPEFRVQSNPTGPYGERRDAVTVTADVYGRFTVGWRWWYEAGWKDHYEFLELGLFTRTFAANGVPVGPESQVDQAPQSLAVFPSQGAAPSGRALLAWTSRGGLIGCLPLPCTPQFMLYQDGSGDSVYARWWYTGDVPMSSEFRVNTYTTGNQGLPSVASDAHGNVLVAWQGDGQDGDREGIFAQRFGGLVPAALDVDPVAGSSSDGNHVLEPGETVRIDTAWRNVTGSAQAFSGGAVAYWGAAGGVYTVVDGTASYGVAPDGATAGCAATGDCYTVALGGARPALHWDSILWERIAPGALGQESSWRVHLGESFTDVPRSSPYYRFVETLLHRGVTGGCAAGAYCPSATTTRAQMPVFVLVAREGAGYVPPDCGTPRFADVPASDPFCRWIEELARRGVVSGCGGGNYCAGDAVTREQMAVFLLRTLDPALDPPACTTPMFGDVPPGSPFCRWIEELARRGVVTGCGGGNYCPAAAVTREQMAVFIGASFGLTLYGP